MSMWHVWGDYVHTRPDLIGEARVIEGEQKAAEQTAKRNGFDFDRRVRNGFEPWAAAYSAENAGDQEFAFASHPIVRGFRLVST